MTHNASVIAVMEFGSTARGDSDQYSDKDIFAVVEDVDASGLDTLRSEIASAYQTSPSSVACYSASSFDQMIVHGSLFTWHLRLEGRILYDPDGVLGEAFENLLPYQSFARDIEQFKAIFSDSCEAYRISGILDAFEKHVLFIVARNVCMLLTAHKNQPAFGRRTVIASAARLFDGFPLSQPVSESLEAGHLSYMRNASMTSSSTECADPQQIIREVDALLNFADRLLS